MQIRVNRVKRNNKTYSYAQIVESYRRPSDGMPMHRVLSNLGSLSEIEIENLRLALRASREGKAVVLSSRSRQKPAKILDNLRYLDIAVLLRIWKQWGLTECLEQLMPKGEADMSPATVVAALTIQRCVAPGSKLFATQWIPTSALPELLGFGPSALNNTRLHRVLDKLEESTSALMAMLPPRYTERQKAFSALFLDVTDTWFVGHGPEMAQRSTTKEGMIRRKVGIVLLCNELGYPLRWEVIEGKCADRTAMTDMVRQIAGLSWAHQTPLVCDRAMGNTAQIRSMAKLNIPFVTALTTTEFGSYTDSIPEVAVDTSALPSTDEEVTKDLISQVTEWAQATDMHEVSDDLFLQDLGVVERHLRVPKRQSKPSAQSAAQRAMQLCRALQDAVEEGRHSSYGAAGRELGISRSLAYQYAQLGNLPEGMQRDVLQGAAQEVPLKGLLEIARETDPERQRAAFEQLLSSVSPPAPAKKRVKRIRSQPEGREHLGEPLCVRLVACFNPQRFVEQRNTAGRHCAEIDRFTANLNAALAQQPRKTTAVLAEVDRKLRRYDFVDAFEVTASGKGKKCTHVEVALRPDEWKKRRRYDGWMIIAAHEQLPHSATQLVQLYRDKDMVEKDFGIIKGLVALRPIRHRTEPKVRAHVTICMLALLLERTLHHQLKGRCSARAALEQLETCRLNRQAMGESDAAYTLTETKPEQQRLLRVLRAQELADEGYLTDHITPR
jgi:hypothetical protein